MSPSNVLCLNGSLRGEAGNTARIVARLTAFVGTRARMRTLTLASLDMRMQTLEDTLRAADAFLVCGGVYWNSHGSVLQRFIETVTQWEATDVFVGKAAGVVLTMDSVGGMEVAARLQHMLNLMGCVAPPLGTVVLSRVAQAALAHTDGRDVYTIDDAELLVENLMLASRAPRPPWKTWPVKPTLAVTGAYPAASALPIDHPPWCNG